MEEEPLRVRVVFEDRHLLTKSQRSEGLQRSWLLLTPDVATIADLSSHLTQSFRLQNSCPHGLILSMDDFVLPSFESTCILKDKDIIRVRKKGTALMEVIEIGDDLRCIQGSGAMERESIHSTEKLLTIMESQEDSRGHQNKGEEDSCAVNDDAVAAATLPSEKKNSRKRKHSDELHGSNREKQKSPTCEKPDCTTKGDEDTHFVPTASCSQKKGRSSHKKEKPCIKESRAHTLVASQGDDNAEELTSSVHREECRRRKKSKLVDCEKAIITIDVAENIHLEQNHGHSQKRDRSQKIVHEKDKASIGDDRSDTPVASQLGDGVPKMISSVAAEERNDQAEDNDQRVMCEAHNSNREMKPRSRNALRKKAKRKWLRELKSQESENAQGQGYSNIHGKSPEKQSMGHNVQGQDHPSDIHCKSPGKQSRGQNAQGQDHPSDVHCKSPGKQSRGQNAQGQDHPSDIHGKSPGKQCRRQNAQGHDHLSDVHGKSLEKQTMGKNIEMEEVVVPVVVRPGHIRFEPLGYVQQQSQGPTETLQWKGTTSKKIGQRWGMEKGTSSWNNDNGFNGHSEGREGASSKWHNANGYNDQSNGREKTSIKWNNTNGYNANGYNDQSNGREQTSIKWNNANGYNERSNGRGKILSKGNNAKGYSEQCIGRTITEEGKNSGNGNIHFESLFPLTRLPQLGDVLVYRMVELTSSWCPEVSPFRVGKVSSYSPISMRIILVPLPEYPICLDNNTQGEESELQSSAPPYNEDGSLEIEYSSLVDVRLLKASDSEATTSDYYGREMNVGETTPMNNWERAVANGNVDETPAAETGNSGGWEQIKQALSEKKAQLQGKDGWDNWTPNKSTASGAWSYRALRGSALGPTLAFLRGKSAKYAGGAKYSGKK